MLAFAVTAALGMAMAAPAVAAPEQNPLAGTSTVTCGSDTWEVIGLARSGEGWLLEGPPGTTPARLLGGTYTLTYDDGQVVTVTIAPPPGLADKWLTCRLEGPHEPVGHHTVVDPAYILKTPH